LRAPAVIFGEIAAYNGHKYINGIHDPITNFKQEVNLNPRDPNKEEAAFLQQYVPRHMALKIVPNDNNACMVGNIIFLGDKITGVKSLAETIKCNDGEAKKVYIGVMEHEIEHNKKNHPLKKVAYPAIASLISTYIVTKMFKRIAPYNPKTSLLKHLGVSSLKSISGASLLVGNYIAQLNRVQSYEFEADQGISPQHRDATIRRMNNVLTLESSYLLSMTEQDRSSYLANRSWGSHPPYEERIKRLQNNPTKTA
jgi:hypothetical protein